MKEFGFVNGIHLQELESADELFTLMREQRAWISHTPGSGCYFAHVSNDKLLYYVPPSVMMEVIDQLKRCEMYYLPGGHPSEQVEEKWQEYF